MKNGFRDLFPQSPQEAYIPTPYEKNVHNMLFHNESGKRVVEQWKKEILTRKIVTENDDHLSERDIWILVGKDNLKKELMAIVEKINTGGIK